MPLDADIKVAGTTQTTFNHQNGIKSRAGTSIVIRSNHSVKAPRDFHTGLASGKRQHEPFEVELMWDASMINFYTALSTNEVLKSVTIRYYQTTASGMNLGLAAGSGGESKEALTCLLENAVVNEIRWVHPYTRAVDPELKNKDNHIVVLFTYQKITWTVTNGGKTYTDDWAAPT